jgi:hypothetical protein
MNYSLKKQIERRAYELWQAANEPDALTVGRPGGRDIDFWLQAESELTPISDHDRQSEADKEVASGART